METTEVKHGRTYRSLKNRKPYYVSGFCKMKAEDGIWVPGVIYQDFTDVGAGVFVRSVENFAQRFEVIE